MDSNTFFFIIFFALFSGVFLFLGFLGYKKTKTANDYFIAGGKMGSIFIAFSYGATFISAVALIGFSGIASLYGFSLLWLAFLTIFVGIFIAFLVFGLKTRRIGRKLGAVTLPDIIGKRFGDKRLQAVSGLIISVFMILYTAAVFLAVASTIEVAFGIPYGISVVIFTVVVGVYITFGGMYTTIWSHAIQGVVMLAAMVILGIWTYSMLGGLVPAHEAAAAITTAQAPNGLTSMPDFMSAPFMLLMTLLFGVGIGVLAQPQLIVRYLTAKSEKALKMAIPYGGFFILCMTFIAFSLGPLTQVLMANNGIAYPNSPDKVLTLVVSELFPTWFLFVFLFAILSAAMSTACGLFQAAGASFGRDVYGVLKNDMDSAKTVKVSRMATIVIVIATLFLSMSPPDVVAFMTAFFFGLMGSTFLAIYALTLYWKKLSKAGAWAGIMSGFIISIVWYVLVYGKTAKLIFDPLLVGDFRINLLDPLFLALPLSFTLAFVVSKLAPQSAEEAKLAEECYIAMKTKEYGGCGDTEEDASEEGDKEIPEDDSPGTGKENEMPEKTPSDVGLENEIPEETDEPTPEPVDDIPARAGEPDDDLPTPRGLSE